MIPEFPLPPLVLNPPPNVTFIRDVYGLSQVQDFMEHHDLFGDDVETDPKKDYYWRRCRTWQVGNQEQQFVVDLLGLCDDDPEQLFKEQGDYGKHLDKLVPLVDTFGPYLSNPKKIKAGVNLGFEYLTRYWLFGLRTCGFWDCSVVERCIYAGLHSLKDYEFYGMESMMGRYYKASIDKSLQTSFDLSSPLTLPQIEYAALDTRTPLAIKKCQEIIVRGDRHAALLHLPDQIFHDDLREVCRIENDCIGVFQDMPIHGETMDKPKWSARTQKVKNDLAVCISSLDDLFIPLVGRVDDGISDEELKQLEFNWKQYNIVTDHEKLLHKQAIAERKAKNFEAANLLENKRNVLEQERKATKESLKKVHNEASKRRTVIKNLREKCEGNALINYGSGPQVKAALIEKYPCLEKLLPSMEDEVLEAAEIKHPEIKALGLLRQYSTLSKQIDTYGTAWVSVWKTHPCNEEGWLHPGDGRLHCTFNQYDAETGRSSSDSPNAQNLPQDKEVRSCFIADPPDESIRVCAFCLVEMQPKMHCWLCPECGLAFEHSQTLPLEYQLLTIDMSGAELRILAEEADEPVWIEAFHKGQDVHAIVAEMCNEEMWPSLALNDCAYYRINPETGEPSKKPCACPGHKEKRGEAKPTNFGLPYGISEVGLAVQLKKTTAQVRRILAEHRARLPRLWAYLDKSGKLALDQLKSLDMFGRRRIFRNPKSVEEQERKAIEWDKKSKPHKMLLPEDVCKAALAGFEKTFGRKPSDEEKYNLTHRKPNAKELASAYRALCNSIERKGKNHRIQSCNATIIKLAMGAGFDKDGKPYLWHLLPQYRAKLVKMVHDELVILVPTIYAEKLALVVKDAFRRAAATHMVKVVMDSDYEVAPYWKKS